MIWFQFYPARVESKRPIGAVTLDNFIESIRSPNDKISSVFELISTQEKIAYSGVTDEEKKEALKEKSRLKQEYLYYFTPCVYTDGNGRGYINIGFFTGIAVMDFDHIDNAEDFKNFVFDNYKFVICAFLSPSKRGVKFMVKIPIVESVDEFKEYFNGLGVLFQRFRGWDGSNQNPVLPLFLSIDKNILHRTDPEIFQDKGKVLNAFVASESEAVIYETDDEKKKRVYRNIKSKFDGIIDNGHPQVRAAGIALGGYVASGYLDPFEAEEMINGLIRSNAYLSKGIKGYCKTAKTAIQTGQASQLILR